jgi:hypothetical protein
MQKAQRDVKVNEEIERQTIELLYIPASMTNKSQPLDYRILRSLKQRLWARGRGRGRGRGCARGRARVRTR